MSDLSNCSASEPYALRVIGNDMAPEFNDGHIIIVDPGGRLRSGSFVVARQGETLIFRQLQIVDREYRLQTLRADDPVLVLANGERDIVGVVSQRSGKRRNAHKRYDA